MGGGGTPVMLYVYDLSRGLARQFSAQFLGKHFDGIWHTAIVVFGKEYFYGGGIMVSEPMQTPFGTPVKEIDLGTTSIPQALFEEFLQGLSHRYLPENYHVLDNNCNNFTDECSQFLTGSPIPKEIRDLPAEFASTPLGAMLRPMIDNFFSSQKQQLAQYQMFQPGVQNKNTQSNSNSSKFLSHSIPILFTAANIPQVFGKLKQLIAELKVSLSDDETMTLNQLENILNEREKVTVLPAIPTQAHTLLVKLLSNFPVDKQFVLLDVFRLLVLFPSISVLYTTSQKDFINNLLEQYLHPKKEGIPVASKMMVLRLLCNLFGSKEGSNFVMKDILESILEATVNAVQVEDPKIRTAGASLAFNISLFLNPNDEEPVIRLVSALVHALKSEKDSENEFTTLLTIGKLVKGNSSAVELAVTMDFHPKQFINTGKQPKTQQLAEELQLLFVEFSM